MSTAQHQPGLDRGAGPDPFDLEIIASSLIAIGEEMFVTTQRTSQSTIIYEVLDFAVGITDADGNLITQGNGVTLFLSTLADAARAIRRKFPLEQIGEGDIYLLNDPYVGGGTHLSDVTVAMPVFHDGALIAFVCNKAHWTEVGGQDAGSVSTRTTEIYQEGLQLPCVKLADRGVENSALVDLIRANVRLPDMSSGDLYAQVASVRLADERLKELCSRFGRNVLMESIAQMMRHSEELARRELAHLPRGQYVAEDWLEGSGGDPVPIQVCVTVESDRFVCDFTGTHAELPGPTNCSRTGLSSAARTVYKALLDPQAPLTEGTFAPLDVICPEGTVFTATRPAATSLYWEVLARAADLVWKAMAEVVPHRSSAGHFATTCADLIAGTHPETGEMFILFEPNAGGWGAGEGKDGERGLVNIADGETFMIPVEIAEAKYGVHVEQYSFNVAGAGAGRWRGGEGVIRDYRITSEDATATGISERSIFPPWGAAGGAAGSTSAVEVVPGGDGEPESVTMEHRAVARGDIVRIRSGSGGGWGDPLERDPQRVAQDVRNEFLTVSQAADVYGVRVDLGTFAVIGLTPEGAAARGA